MLTLSFEFPCGDVSLARPELNINLGPVVPEQYEGYPLFTAFGRGYASAGQGTSPHALVQSERERVHPEGEPEDDALRGGDYIPILLPIRAKYLNISQWIQCPPEGFSDIGMRGQALDVVEHLAIDADLQFGWDILCHGFAIGLICLAAKLKADSDSRLMNRGFITGSVLRQKFPKIVDFSPEAGCNSTR